MSAVRPAVGAPDPSVGDLLAAWLPGRRWFPAGGASAAGVRVEPWLAVTFDDDASGGGDDGDGADVVVLLVRLRGAGVPGGEVVAQVPLVLTDPAARGPGFITELRTAAGDVAVHDGGAHPACWLTLLRAAGVGDGVDGRALTAAGHVVAGEQSNTSVVLPGAPSPDGTGGMLKILRTVTPGPHPDVVVPRALTRAGWDGVPRFLGAVQVTTDPGTTTALAVLSELVPHARDGFELACEHAGRGESFAHLAADLGRVVAELHTVLVQAMPPGPLLDPATFVAGLRDRAVLAVAEAPGLAARAPAIDALLDDLQGRLPRLRLQTVHGDLHLGQALHGETGWKLLDFEGEPQRPAEERAAPDLPLRDVAGMIRSFAYAAAVGGAPDPSWEAEAVHAFLGRYRQSAAPAALQSPGTRRAPELDPPTADAALAALVLDKALYEVVYETRQRPTWVHIPLSAVDRVLESARRTR
ncbi:aminoglycoside phosphotransferase [Krasilnikoviella flava]|uniref:Maltokinase n=1 Tax=Krasilnikoviella flava TaxID=526729 RepID=A0A1T5I781_9MICO|nr:aminoglycoside phosphotransferase [Krasilnikoviella flava]SKC35035.1 maltokinase [Krasilnikoviella flava]